ncbi:MAG TPA: patatin-like phospholipase family protein [Mycobacterium sp.]|nr:patatin-like phospholipase family protein [Mycobacterium sp.]
MLQALSEHDITPDLVAGTSVGSLNGAVVAFDPKGAPNRLSHLWARVTRKQVFPGGLLSQGRTLRRTKTHLFPNTRLAALITDFMGATTAFGDLALPSATWPCLRRRHHGHRRRASIRRAGRPAAARAVGQRRHPRYLPARRT